MIHSTGVNYIILPLNLLIKGILAKRTINCSYFQNYRSKGVKRSTFNFEVPTEDFLSSVL